MLLISTIVVIIITLLLPYAPFREMLGFVPLPTSLMFMLIAITLLYVVVVEVAKKFFYRGVVSMS